MHKWRRRSSSGSAPGALAWLDTYQSMQADIIIKPKLYNIDQLAFDKATQAIRDGEDAARAAIPEIRKKLNLDFGLWKS